MQEKHFEEIARIIKSTRAEVTQTVNATLLHLYWTIGREILKRIEDAGWGRNTVVELADYIQKTDGGSKGFSPQNLWRMRQYYLACEEQEKFKSNGAQLSWSHNLALMSRCKTADERLFYLDLAVQQKWTFRELERQLGSALYLRQQASPVKLSTVLREIYPSAEKLFKDSYVFDFLQLPSQHSEKDLHHALLDNLKQFLIELGRDFCFVASEFKLQVG